MPFDGTPTTTPLIVEFDRAVALIDKPRKWTQFRYRRTRFGWRGFYTAYCLHAAFHTEPKVVAHVEVALCRRTGHCMIGFNDVRGRTHAQVMAILASVRNDLLMEERGYAV